MNKFYELFEAIYAGIKFVLGLNKYKCGGPLRCLLAITTVLVLLLTTLSLAPFYFFYVLVDVCLKVRNGNKYGGMLKERDLLMEIPRRPIGFNIVFIIKRNGTYKEFEKALLENFEKAHKSCIKLSSEIDNFLGYKYYLRTNVKFENIVTVIEDVFLTRDTFVDYLYNNFSNISFLKNKSWNISILKQPLKWSSFGMEPQQHMKHIVVLTFRHSVCDGVAILSFFGKVFDGFEMFPFTDLLRQSATNQIQKSLDEGYIYDNPFKQNASFQRLDFRNYLTFYNEEKTKYIHLIKAIKTKLKVGFSDVLSGCLTFALVSYAKKRNIDINFLRLAHIIRPMDKETFNMLQGEFDFDNVSNKMLAFYLNTPRGIGSTTLSETIKECYQSGRDMKAGSDFALLLVSLKLIHVLPNMISEFLFRKVVSSVNQGISNVVGIKSATFNGHNVELMLPFITDSLDTGFILIVASMGNKLQLSFTGPRSVLCARSDLDGILVDMFKNIDDLYSELECNDN